MMFWTPKRPKKDPKTTRKGPLCLTFLEQIYAFLRSGDFANTLLKKFNVSKNGVSDLFLNNGLIVYTEGRIKDSKLKFTAKPTEVFKNIPITPIVKIIAASIR